MSLPSWERGLKSYEIRVENNYPLVAPLVGAWIEIDKVFVRIYQKTVAPLVGAWIEMHKSFVMYLTI